MNEELIKERLNIIDKEIEKHEKRITTLERTYSIMEKMDYRVSQIEKTIAEIDKKLDASYEEKGKKWDKLVDYVFYFILSALLTYLCVKTGIKQEVLRKDILIRAVKTFIQTFLAAFLLGTDNLSNLDEKTLKSALIGGLAAGISAVMNLIINLLSKGE